MKLNKKNWKPSSSNKYLIIGYGKFGKGFAQRLLKEGVKESKIYIVDKNQEMLTETQNQFTNVMSLTISDFDSLNAFDVNEIKIVVIAMSDLEESLMIAANCVKYPDKKYFAKAKNEIHSKLLKTLGVDDVVIPEEEIGSKLAYKSLFTSNIEIKNVDDDYNIIHVKIKPNFNFENKTLADLNIRSKIECNIFGIKRDGVFFVPSGNDVIKVNDILSIVYKKDLSKQIIDFFGGL
ncbi:TrkA family potassium uptake protein [Malacoplasma penetrans]|uniref:Potassium uptake protein KtrA n=1 Tax=Malacoplasma penetrans (strain HF-2) TaxID=272633 RepID=Q8EWA3_MALP2|nr:TrkA family potassium uptake protein [Malacoplasma penetrans]RXY96785.1 TrkA family potassium uptake protein [Malacoplasma penetrans]BAC44093.1 potassium uptake protein KtrA [Malacoplasma penetrans HF-2]